MIEIKIIYKDHTEIQIVNDKEEADRLVKNICYCLALDDNEEIPQFEFNSKNDS